VEAHDPPERADKSDDIQRTTKKGRAVDPATRISVMTATKPNTIQAAPANKARYAPNRTRFNENAR
jgi:hypothetical protein